MDDHPKLTNLFAVDEEECCGGGGGGGGVKCPARKESEGEEKLSVTMSAEENEDIRIAMIGNVDSGKSTLIGVLCSGNLDDGRGAARSTVFTHKHETSSGRTSAISHQLIGFKDSKQVFVPTKKGKLSKGYWSELVKRTTKNVLLIDLCGHRKYLKTTIFGLTGQQPHYAVVLVGSNMGVPKMTKEHIGIACALKIPIIVVVTKVDICPPKIFKQTMAKLKKILRAANKTPYIVGKMEKVKKAIELTKTSTTTCPVFITSNVTGRGITELREFIGALDQPRIDREISLSPPTVGGSTDEKAKAVAATGGDDGAISSLGDEGRTVVQIDSVFNVSGVGLVVSGIVRHGSVKINQQLLLGPDKVGVYKRILVRGIHVNRCAVTSVSVGKSSSFAIRAIARKQTIARNNVRKGMVLLDERYDESRRTTSEFDAEILILHHQTTCGEGYSPVLHLGTVRQAAKILSVEKISTTACAAKRSKKKKGATGEDAAAEEEEAKDDGKLRTGDRAIVRFKFLYHPEFIHEGDPMLFREGFAKGIGKVLRRVK